MFVRSVRHPFGRALSRNASRGLIAALYVLYPLGCSVRLPPLRGMLGAGADIVGLLMITASLVAFALVAGSSLQRQAQEPEYKLDERERAERNRATYLSYSMFSALVIAGAFYLMIATDLAQSGRAFLWIPQTGDHWNGIVCGLLLLSLTLPAAVLAWRGASPDAEEQSHMQSGFSADREAQS